ncbi:hypothetical protein BGX27_003017, partial [Mortierella sp. AM989]
MTVLCPPDMSDGARKVLEDTARTCFLNGCPVDLHRMLQGLDIAVDNQKTVHELCAAAGSPATPSTGMQPFITAHTAATVQHNPMAMEIDAFRLQINALQQQQS